MLKFSREAPNVRDALDYLQWNFNPSPDMIVKDLLSLKRNVQDSISNLSKESQMSSHRMKTNSLSGFVNKNAKNYKETGGSDNDDDEIDNFDSSYKLPKPQPRPQQLVFGLDESKDSQKTGTFLHGNEQTFDQDARGHNKLQNLLSDSIKKMNPPIPTNHPLQPSPWDSDIISNYAPSQSYGKVLLKNLVSSSLEKLSPFAEKLLNQQDQQLKFLQAQILNLQVNSLTHF